MAKRLPIVTVADIHLRNDDSYGVYDESGLNDFLTIRCNAAKQAIKCARSLGAHFIVAGDFLDSRLVDSPTLYYSSKLIKMMCKLRFVILMEGNHGYDDKRGTFSVIAHWKHLATDNVRIVTYPKIECKDGIGYVCIPALSSYDGLGKLISKLYDELKGVHTKVLILHGPIVGAKFESGKENTSGISDKIIKTFSRKFDYVVCGDLHRYQKVYKDNVWYCGANIQSSLKDKGQPRGFQIIHSNGVVQFKESNAPKFYELVWEPGVKKSRLLKEPDERFKNAIVVVKLIGTSAVIDKIDREKIKSNLVEAGALRVFIDTKTNDTSKSRVIIDKDMTYDEMIKRFCEHKKASLPADLPDVVRKGVSYLK